MKRILSAILALSMTVSLAMPVAAEGLSPEAPQAAVGELETPNEEAPGSDLPVNDPGEDDGESTDDTAGAASASDPLPDGEAASALPAATPEAAQEPLAGPAPESDGNAAPVAALQNEEPQEEENLAVGQAGDPSEEDSPALSEVPVDEEHFPDQFFRESMVRFYDTDGNGILSVEELQNLRAINYGSSFDSVNFEGIEYLSALQSLSLMNYVIKNLDLSGTKNLSEFGLQGCRVDRLTIGQQTNLQSISGYQTKLWTLDLTQCTALQSVYFADCSLLALDLPAYELLSGVWVEQNVVEMELSADGTLSLTDWLTEEQLARVSLVDSEGGSIVYQNGVFSGLDPQGGTLQYLYDTNSPSGKTMQVTIQYHAYQPPVLIDQAFPDPTFRAYVRENFDADQDGILSAKERYQVDAVTTPNAAFGDLTGIESFPGLNYLNLTYSSTDTFLTSLPISSNKKLRYLSCNGSPQMTELDVSELKDLQHISLWGTGIQKLDLTHNTALTRVFCENNELTELLLPENDQVYTLLCENNKLESLDLSSQTRLTTVNVEGNPLYALKLNPDLGMCQIQSNSRILLQTDDNCQINLKDCYSAEDIGRVSLLTEGLTMENGVISGLSEAQGSFQIRYDTGNAAYPLDIEVSYVKQRQSVVIDAETFPDDAFRTMVLEQYDTDADGILNSQEQNSVNAITIEGWSIHNLKGIEVFSQLEELRYYCWMLGSEYGLQQVDLSGNPKLTRLYLSGCYGLTELDVSALPGLQELSVSGSQLTELDLSRNPDLQNLTVNCDQITALDLRGNQKLTSVNVGGPSLEQLDVSMLPELWYLSFRNTPISSLDLSQNHQLNYLYGNSALLTLDLSPDAPLSCVDGVDSTVFLESEKDGTLRLADSLTLAQCGSVTILDEGLSFDPAAGTVSGLGREGAFQYRYGTGNEALPSILVTVEYAQKRDPVAINAETFPDEVFRNYVSSSCDLDQDGVLSSQEQFAVTEIPLSYQNVCSLAGVENFPNLERLSCENYSYSSGLPAGGLKELDLSANKKLTYLALSGNKGLKTIDLSAQPRLQTLYLHDAGLTSLDVTHNPELISLGIGSATFHRIDLSQNKKLTELSCWGAKLTELDLSNQEELRYLYASGTEIRKLDLTNNHNLLGLNLSYGLTALDLAGDAMISGYYPGKTNVFLPLAPDGRIDLKEALGFTAEQCGKVSISSGDGISYDSETGVITGLQAEGSFEYTYDTGNTNCASLVVSVQYGEGIPTVEINEENFPDATFRQVVSQLDFDDSGKLEDNELRQVVNLWIQSFASTTCNIDNSSFNLSFTLDDVPPITSFKGIEKFTELKRVYISCTRLAYIDVAGLPRLESFNIPAKQSVYGDYTQNASGQWQLDLKQFLSAEQLNNVQMPENTDDTYDAQTGVVTLDKLHPVEYRYRTGFVSAEGNPFLLPVQVYSREEDGEGALPLTEEWIPDEAFRRAVRLCADMNNSGALSKNEIARIKTLYLNNMNTSDLTGIGLFTELEDLDVGRNHLSVLDLRGNTKLKSLRCSDNQISVLRIDGCKDLERLYCDRNKLSMLDLTGFDKLTYYISICPQYANTDLVGVATADGYQIHFDEGFVADPTKVTVDYRGCPVAYYPGDGVAMITQTPSAITYTYDTGLVQRDGIPVLLGVTAPVTYQGVYTPPKTEDEKQEISNKIEQGQWGDEKEAEKKTPEEKKRYEDDKKTVGEKVHAAQEGEKAPITVTVSDTTANTSVTVTTSDVDIATKILTSDEELRDVINSDEITVTTKVEVQEVLSQEEVKKEQEALQESGLLGKEETVGVTLDINVSAEVEKDGETLHKKKVDETNGALIFSAQVPKDKIPEAAEQEEIVYSVIRIHNGQVERLDADDVHVTVDENGVVTVSFRADKFSTYNITVEKLVKSIYGEIKSVLYSIQDGLLTGFVNGSTVQTLLSNLTGSSLEIYDQKGSRLSAADTVGTGDTVSNGVQTLTLLLYGDVDGIAGVSIDDVIAMRRHLLHVESLKGVYLQAASPTSVGTKEPNLDDVIQVRRYLLHIVDSVV